MLEKDLNFVHNKLYNFDEQSGQRLELLDQDTDFQVGEMTHPTTTLNIMGEYEAIDYTRLLNFTCTVTLPNGKAIYDIYNRAGVNGLACLCGVGRQQRYVNGLLRNTQTEIRVVGNIVNMPSLSLASEQAGGSSITINVLKLYVTYTDDSGGVYVLHDIDRTNDKLVFCGIDRREGLNEI